MPIITTLVMARSILAGSGSERLVGDTTAWPMISAAGQVAVETLVAGGAEAAVHGAAGLRGHAQGAAAAFGMYTVSTQLPDATRTTHLRVPSLEMSSLTISGTADLGTGLELFAQGLAEIGHGVEVVRRQSGESSLITWPARKRFSPMHSKNRSSSARVKPSRLAGHRAVMDSPSPVRA